MFKRATQRTLFGMGLVTAFVISEYGCARAQVPMPRPDPRKETIIIVPSPPTPPPPVQQPIIIGANQPSTTPNCTTYGTC